MQRTKRNEIKADAILTSDWHLRETKPICRIDDFLKTQWRKMEYVDKLAMHCNCSVLHPGDLFHHWKASPFLISMALKYIPSQFLTIYGQHDLPNHNIKLCEKSALYTMFMAQHLDIAEGGSWGITPLANMPSIVIKGRKILLWHILTYAGEKPWPGAPIPSAKDLLKDYPEMDLIVTGDNHQAFTEEYKGRLLVNPGSLMRQKSDQIDFKPRVYLWDAESNSVTPHYIPIEDSVVDDSHIKKQEERNERIDAFISRISVSTFNAELDFRANLEEFFRDNEIRQAVIDIILKALEFKNEK